MELIKIGVPWLAGLPACLLHAGDLTLISKLSEADSADTELAHIGMRSAADLASVVGASGKFRRSLLLGDH